MLLTGVWSFRGSLVTQKQKGNTNRTNLYTEATKKTQQMNQVIYIFGSKMKNEKSLTRSTKLSRNPDLHLGVLVRPVAVGSFCAHCGLLSYSLGLKLSCEIKNI